MASCKHSITPQSITALWLVLISRPAEGRKLSWPGWFARPNTVTDPRTNGARRRVTSLIRRPTLLPLRLTCVTGMNRSYRCIYFSHECSSYNSIVEMASHFEDCTRPGYLTGLRVTGSSSAGSREWSRDRSTPLLENTKARALCLLDGRGTTKRQCISPAMPISHACIILWCRSPICVCEAAAVQINRKTAIFFVARCSARNAIARKLPVLHFDDLSKQRTKWSAKSLSSSSVFSPAMSGPANSSLIVQSGNFCAPDRGRPRSAWTAENFVLVGDLICSEAWRKVFSKGISEWWRRLECFFAAERRTHETYL